MKKTLHRIGASLERLGGDREHQDAALLALREATESFPDSSLEQEMRCILAGAASEMEDSGEVPPRWKESPPSERFHRWREQYSEAVDHHPAFALRLGRIADAFATLGL